MSRLLTIVSAGLLTVALGAQQASEGKPLAGFTAAHAAEERKWEKQFQAVPDSARIQSNMHRLAAHPHNVGSAAQRENAEWLVQQFKSWGFDTKIEQFDVLYPTPEEELLEMTVPVKYTARLSEPKVAEDPYTKDQTGGLPPYNIYAVDGDVTAPLVYVNYGMLTDYDELARQGISVNGAIVIARYGGGWRGLKPKLAYMHGAVGCIIYSDPAEDGYGAGDVIPKGPMRPEWGVQRGSVADTTLYAGDPLTPGIGSVAGAKRIAAAASPVIMKIPTLPISWGDAKPLLEHLDGRTVPREWRGALPITYHFGPGPSTVHLKVKSKWETKPVLDVIATMKGRDEPETLVLRGNHFDGWVNGADDPVSGQSAMLEEARGLGELAKSGWKPRRTIIYAAWDGEEPGLLGSTEWAETHADELTKHAAVYINSDENGRGIFGAGGSHSLERMVNDVAGEMQDPEVHSSVQQRQRAAAIAGAGRSAKPEGAETAASVPLEAIGSGSDFAPFLDHLGIASLNVGFGGEDHSGTYHSDYDDPWHWDQFMDRDQVYGKLFAQTAGTMVLRMADADVLPYDFTRLSAALRDYTTSVKDELKQMRSKAETRSRNLNSGVYQLADDPKRPMHPPKALPMPPEMDFAGLELAVAKLDAAATRYQERSRTPEQIAPEKRVRLNEGLAVAERRLLSEQGLPGRAWVKHTLYAPGTYSGYGASTLPGVREALEDNRFDEAKQQLAVLAASLNAEAEYIERLTVDAGAK